MGLFASDSSHGYAPRHMPAAKRGLGPWGAAIRYWFPRKNMNGADLMRATGLKKNTISRAVRGLPVNTTTLTKIAQAFKEPVELILVSPEWMEHAGVRRQMIQDAVESALRNSSPYGAAMPPPALPTIEEKSKDLGQFIEAKEREEKEARARAVSKKKRSRKK